MIIQAPHKLNNTTITLPLSKSIANRVMILSFLAGKSLKDQLVDSDDSILMKRLLEQASDGRSDGFYNAGHAGTVFRFMSAILALTPGVHVLTGSERMQQRPCSPLVDALSKMGASVEYLVNFGYPPIKITGGSLDGGFIEIDSSISSQFISALLMIAPHVKGGLTIKLTGNTVSLPYINMTIGLMRECGINVTFENDLIQVPEGHYTIITNLNEADWSAASYWYTLVALSGNSRISLPGLNSNSLQGDKALIELYKDLGVESEWKEGSLEIYNSGKIAKSLSIDLKSNPDLAPSIAIACAGLQVEAELSGLETLVIKESNRLEAIENELSKLGYSCTAQNNNTLLIKPVRSSINNRYINTYNDHRIAMALSLLSVIDGKFEIEDHEVVNKSYPNFWKDLESAGFHIEY